MSMPALAPEATPQPLIGLATLMTMAFQNKDLTALGQQLLERAGQDDAEAFLDLSVLLQLQGNTEMGLTLQQEALSIKQHFTLPPAKQQSGLRVLAIMAPGDLMTNIPLEFIAEGAGFTLEMLYVSPELPMPREVPDHDIAIMALSELDRNQATLAMLEPIMPHWPRPVLNLPEHVKVLARDEVCQALQGITGITMPTTGRLTRVELEQIAAEKLTLPTALTDVDFPAIIRPLDSHAGHGLERLENAAQLSQYLAQQPDEAFFVSRFIDYSSEDGQFRKYRVVVMQGRPYIGHMAISSHWMVHYLNAGMVENAEKRLEEAYVMGTFDQGFAARHEQAIHELWQRTGVDYIGLDCAETRDGKLLIFEAGTSMVVHSMDPVETYPYKRPQMNKLYAGFNQMLVRHITLSGLDSQLERVMPFITGRSALDKTQLAV
ncbi:MAG: hypothetical protein OIF57_02635 [Marinobacterium sp.]|nr:hypothetical protein [Marinobacterium sp.]